MTHKDDGGFLISEDYAKDIARQYAALNLYVGPRREPEPLTLRQRMRVAWIETRWAIHDRLFPECRD